MLVNLLNNKTNHFLAIENIIKEKCRNKICNSRIWWKKYNYKLLYLPKKKPEPITKLIQFT